MLPIAKITLLINASNKYRSEVVLRLEVNQIKNDTPDISTGTLFVQKCT